MCMVQKKIVQINRSKKQFKIINNPITQKSCLQTSCLVFICSEVFICHSLSKYLLNSYFVLSTDEIVLYVFFEAHLFLLSMYIF